MRISPTGHECGRRPDRGLLAALSRVFGTNPFGNPNYRLVWGWDRLELVGARFTLFDEHGNETGSRVQHRIWPKYSPHARWYLETWTPPPAGGREAWENSTQDCHDGQFVLSLGPYPSRGDYEQFFSFEHEPNTEMAFAAAYRHRASKEHSFRERFDFYEKKAKTAERKKLEEDEAMVRDSLRTGLRPMVGYNGAHALRNPSTSDVRRLVRPDAVARTVGRRYQRVKGFSLQRA